MKIKLGEYRSSKCKLEDLIFEIEKELESLGWKNDDIRKYIKRIVSEYFNQ